MTPTVILDMLETQQMLDQMRKQHFMENVLFSYQWGFLVLLTVGLWVIWAILVDKKRLGYILLAGLIPSLIATVLDDTGLSLGLWIYFYNLAPFLTLLFPVNIAIIPVSFMLLFQYAKTWKSYLVMLTLLVLFAVFIAEPFFVAIGIYVQLNWEHWYGFPIYILMGVFVKWVVDRLEKVS